MRPAVLAARLIPRRVARGAGLALALLLGACAAAPGSADLVAPAAMARQLADLPPVDLILLGEQHDAPAHQALQRALVQELAARQGLAALALEMAPAGASTQGLDASASEEQAQTALHWSDAAWPWSAYGPTVMAALRAGVPVWGANLPQAEMRAAMRDATLDPRLSAAALAAQEARIREGHCDLLPPGQIRPMARIQIARDLRMARTLDTLARQAAGSGRRVLFIAGSGHVDRALGVPQHLPADLRLTVVQAQAGGGDAARDIAADVRWATPALPPKDYCAEVRRPTRPGAAAAPPPAPGSQ